MGHVFSGHHVLYFFLLPAWPLEALSLQTLGVQRVLIASQGKDRRHKGALGGCEGEGGPWSPGSGDPPAPCLAVSQVAVRVWDGWTVWVGRRNPEPSKTFCALTWLGGRGCWTAGVTESLGAAARGLPWSIRHQGEARASLIVPWQRVTSIKCRG